MSKEPEMTLRAGLLGLSCLRAVLQPAGAQTPSVGMVAPTPQDCAVIAAIGEGQLGWREQSPDMAMHALSYGAGCDWKALGVMPFQIAATAERYYADTRFSFGKPQYTSNGTDAQDTLDESTHGGPYQTSFVRYDCSAHKDGELWRFVSCKPHTGE